MLIFRKMKECDIPGVGALMGELHALHASSRPDMYVPVSDPYTRAEYEKRGTSPDWISLVAVLPGEDGACDDVLGVTFVELRRREFMVDGLYAYMHDIVVRSDCRRQKIGTMLYRMAEREARERGAVRLDLCVWSFNSPAAAFYERMGFVPQRQFLEKDIREEHFESDCGHGK